MDFSPYAGRWVALTENNTIASVGATRDETRVAARVAYPKERLRLAWVAIRPPHIPLPEWPLAELHALLLQEGIWLVGGPVRDLGEDATAYLERTAAALGSARTCLIFQPRVRGQDMSEGAWPDPQETLSIWDRLVV